MFTMVNIMIKKKIQQEQKLKLTECMNSFWVLLVYILCARVVPLIVLYIEVY